MSNTARGSQISPAKTRGGFTLIEILIVVIILGILAAIVIPQFTGAAQGARENTLRDLTQHLRSQITIYKGQHRDRPPGTPVGGGSVDAGTFVEQMTQFSDEDGNTNPTASTQYKYGPYLPKMAVNPLSNLSTLTVVTVAMPSPDGTTGWLYKPDSLEIVPNSAGADATGIAFTDY